MTFLIIKQGNETEIKSSSGFCYTKFIDKAKTVEQYIAKAPKEFQSNLKQLRELIKKIAPKATERISYGMPFYDYQGRLAYFAAMKSYIGVYIPPPIIAQHASQLKNYKTTKSAIHIPLGKLPAALIKKLVKARIKHNQSK